ncbi:ABC transporter substrate-binding protein, partial [Clostridia bacterium OttesenSCG-928-O13]|nr:ABC transporter substrate-binding protein [Clostridia bacterium OttesenSCG-928-O13]
LTAADCEIIYALGAGDMIVGRGEYCDYPAQVLDIEAVQSGSETNVEQIIALAPDVVFMSSMDQNPEQIDQLDGAGIKVIVSEAASIEEVYQSITLIGAAMGKDDEAAALVKEMQDGFEALQAKVPALAAGEEAKTVYFEVSELQYGLWAAGDNTFMHEIATMLALENIFADVSGWAEVSQEQVIERDPDYIVTITMYFGDGPEPAKEIEDRAGWAGITAVENDAILHVGENQLSRPGPRLVEGAQLLYDFVYGG